MPVTGLQQEEDVDAAGTVTTTYVATVTLEDPPATFTVRVAGGSDWADRLEAEIRAEVGRARQVGSLQL